MVDPIECSAQIRVEYPPALGVAPTTHNVDNCDRVLAASARPEPVCPGREPGLPLWFQRVAATCLVDTVGHHGDGCFIPLLLQSPVGMFRVWCGCGSALGHQDGRGH